MKTGYKELDAVLNGLQPGGYYLIGARPAMGKTAFALNITINVAMSGKKVAYFSLEHSKDGVEKRVCLMDSTVDIEKFRRNVTVDDTPGLSIKELKEKSRELSKNSGLDLIVVDYLQLMCGDLEYREKYGITTSSTQTKYAERAEEVAEISKGIKEISEELQVSSIVLTQVPRHIEWRKDHRPLLDDLAHIGENGEICDVVLFIYRDAYYHFHTSMKNTAEIIVAKNRYGESGKTILLDWQPLRMSFVEL